MNRSLIVRAALIISVTAVPLLADFTYDETSQMTGGSMLQVMQMAARFSKDSRKMTQPILTTISFQGNRMLRKTADEATIIDLDKQTITTINFAKKSYSVGTFEELKQQMAAASEKMRSKTADQPTASFDVKVEDTGKTKNVNGSNTHEMKMTMTMSGKDEKSGTQGAMDVVSDMWIAPDVAGYGEARDFQRRMAQSLGWTPGQNPMLSRPDVAKAMAEVYKQGSKLDGMPLATTIRMGANIQGTPATSGQAPSNPDAQNASASPESVAGALAGALGGFGMGRHKKQKDSKDSKDSDPCLMEMTTEINNYNSNPADSAMFQVPSGFEKVDERKHR
ncbi:MAG: DUF4412 domain-containing protein [Acidobacteriota bacterium]|nr:DUF4412 domain-containing protein [Acidobacteriota bacterium]